MVEEKTTEEMENDELNQGILGEDGFEADEIDSVVTLSEPENGCEEAVDSTVDSPEAKIGSEETDGIEETNNTEVAEKADSESALTGTAAAVETAGDDQTDEEDH